jgi:hypothetical protein
MAAYVLDFGTGSYLAISQRLNSPLSSSVSDIAGSYNEKSPGGSCNGLTINLCQRHQNCNGKFRYRLGRLSTSIRNCLKRSGKSFVAVPQMPRQGVTRSGKYLARPGIGMPRVFKCDNFCFQCDVYNANIMEVLSSKHSSFTVASRGIFIR